MAEDFDLDAARRARAEARSETVGFTFGGRRFELPAELNMETGEMLDRGRFRDAYTELLNGQAEAFFELRPTFNDLRDLGEWIAEHYAGLLAGESQASRSVSKPTSRSSRRPSKRTTTST